jgi:hypothetical protein
MDIDALKTIRIHNWKMPRTKAIKLAQKYLEVIQFSYPTGVEDETTYFVIPGFEHVTRFQPIVVYNLTEGIWEVSTTNLFVQQSN